MNAHLPSVDVAVIAGVGQSAALADLESIEVDTPFGPTSEPIRLAEIHGRSVAFLARRATNERLQAHRVPYQANIWALAVLGARALVTSTASSGLRDAFGPGTFVVPDQFIDQTSGRRATFLDDLPGQLSDADPFDSTLRGLAIDALNAQKVRVRDFGTAVVLNGPRQSTRAESRFNSLAGGDFTNMTLLPEATLARELDMAVVNISFITDREDDRTSFGNLSHLDLMRLRVSKAQDTLQRALFELIRTIPQPFTPPQSEATVLRDTLLTRAAS